MGSHECSWTPIQGSDLVILGGVSTLHDGGGDVEVVPAASVHD